MGRKSGVPLSEEQKKLISERLKQYYAEHGYPEEWRKKVSNALKGKTVSDESRQKMSDAHKGKVLSDEHKEKIREGMKNAWQREDSVFQSDEYRKKLRKPSWNLGKITPLEVRNKISAGVRRSNTPESSRRRSQAMILRYMNPENRRKTSDAVNAAYSSEDLREKLSIVQKRRYSDPEERNKQREIIKKSITPESRKKQSEAMRGREFTEEHRRKLSESGRGKHSGENSPFWRGGKYQTPYPSEFTDYLKRKIRKRDNYTCQACFDPLYGKRKVGHVHHIDGDKQNCDMSNLVLVCRTCHNAIHGLNTITNENIEKFKTLLAG